MDLSVLYVAKKRSMKVVLVKNVGCYLLRCIVRKFEMNWSIAEIILFNCIMYGVFAYPIIYGSVQFFKKKLPQQNNLMVSKE